MTVAAPVTIVSTQVAPIQTTIASGVEVIVKTAKEDAGTTVTGTGTTEDIKDSAASAATVAFQTIQGYATNSNADDLTIVMLNTAGVKATDAANIGAYKVAVAEEVSIVDLQALQQLITDVNAAGVGPVGPVVPEVSVYNVSFTDTDEAKGKMGGKLTWTEPANVENVTNYAIYASEEGILGTLLGTVDAGTTEFTIPAGTALSKNILIVAMNGTVGANSTNYAKFVVMDVVADKNITSIKAIDDINVAYGTTEKGLPAKVTLVLDDASEVEADVVWNAGSPTYNANAAGTYNFEGTVTLPDNVTNTSGVKASVKVIVAEETSTPATQLTIADPILTLSKEYDRLTAAVIEEGALTGVASGDTVTVSAVATYDDATVGTSKTITVVYTLGGIDAAKYVKPADKVVETGIITAKQLTIAEPTLTKTKVADGNKTAVVEAGALTGIVDEDLVTVSAVATYDDATVGTNKEITVVYTLGGANAANYITPENKVVNDGAIKEAIKVDSISADNATGKVTINLNRKAEAGEASKIAAMTAKAYIDLGQTGIALTGFAANTGESTDTKLIYDFTPIAKTDAVQSVVVGVTLDGTEVKTTAPLSIAAKTYAVSAVLADEIVDTDAVKVSVTVTPNTVVKAGGDVELSLVKGEATKDYVITAVTGGTLKEDGKTVTIATDTQAAVELKVTIAEVVKSITTEVSTGFAATVLAEGADITKVNAELARIILEKKTATTPIKIGIAEVESAVYNAEGKLIITFTGSVLVSELSGKTFEISILNFETEENMLSVTEDKLMNTLTFTYDTNTAVFSTQE